MLTGTDGLAAGIAQGLWLKGLPGIDSAFDAPYLEPAAKMQEQAEDQGVVVTYYPSGPLLEYMPEPSRTRRRRRRRCWPGQEEPRQVHVARPSDSGPARTFLMGLPYLLGDKDPRDPINGWDKTWAYLKELGKYVDYYPSGTKDTMSGLADAR